MLNQADLPRELFTFSLWHTGASGKSLNGAVEETADKPNQALGNLTVLVCLPGSPPISDADIGSITARNPVDLWKQAFLAYFPQNPAGSMKSQDDITKDVQVRIQLCF